MFEEYDPKRAPRPRLPQPAQPPPDPVLVRRAVLISLGLVLLIGGIWWWRQPAQYQVVARLSAHDSTLLPCTKGFLLRTNAHTFVLYDWHGRVRWRASTADASGRATAGPTEFSVSPDGSFFAAAIVEDGRIHLRSWQEGHALYHGKLPRTAHERYRVKALDSGRIFAWAYTTPESTALAIAGTRIVARGTLLPHCVMAPDGGTVVGRQQNGVQYAGVIVRDGKITITPSLPIDEAVNLDDDPTLVTQTAAFAGGAVVSRRGTVYRLDGGMTRGSGWQHATISPQGTATLQTRGKECRIFLPATGAAWAFSLEGNLGGDATDDGRYALVWKQVRLPELLVHDEPASGQARVSRFELVLYERPGRVRARLPIRALPQEATWYPSPDGKAIAFNATRRDGGFRCRVYRLKR